METRIVKGKINLKELKRLAHEQYGDIIKAVVDIEQEILGVGGELHVDIQSILMRDEHSEGHNTWGINLHLEKSGDDFVEFDSMINLKPMIGNKTRDVKDPEIRNRIRSVVDSIVVK